MYSHRMKWSNLKENKCPKCNKDWVFDLELRDGIMAHTCGFKIRESKYKEILSDRVNADIDTSAHCTKCGEPIRGDEDALCGYCAG